jgi:hypothetical protein
VAIVLLVHSIIEAVLVGGVLYSDAHRNSTSRGNQTVNLNSNQNDQATSLEVATFNYTCKTTW